MLFNKTDHTYFEGKVQFLPVSDWVKQFYKSFPRKSASIGSAKKAGVTQEHILGKWDLKAEFSVDYGNAIHKAIEYWLKYKEMPDHEHLKKVVKCFIKVHKKLYPAKVKHVVSEMIVYDKKIKVAGTIDVTTGIGDKIIFIDDVKSNGDIRKAGYNRMLAPFQMMKDSPLNKYRLQLSMYWHLAESMGLKPKGSNILYWNGEDIEVIKVDKIDLKEALLKTK